MGSVSLEESLQQEIDSTPVGKDVVVRFKGVPQNIDVELTFTGGWIVKQKIIPGGSLVFTKGEAGHLQKVTIYINPYDGLS
jgi:hypothetical protein|tara:strand:- start:1890 stop:2132 length:243 start_codon:yes stop_codon:yes gene_type:complete